MAGVRVAALEAVDQDPVHGGVHRSRGAAGGGGQGAAQSTTNAGVGVWCVPWVKQMLEVMPADRFRRRQNGVESVTWTLGSIGELPPKRGFQNLEIGTK